MAPRIRNEVHEFFIIYNFSLFLNFPCLSPCACSTSTLVHFDMRDYYTKSLLWHFSSSNMMEMDRRRRRFHRFLRIFYGSWRVWETLSIACFQSCRMLDEIIRSVICQMNSKYPIMIQFWFIWWDLWEREILIDCEIFSLLPLSIFGNFCCCKCEIFWRKCAFNDQRLETTSMFFQVGSNRLWNF